MCVARADLCLSGLADGQGDGDHDETDGVGEGVGFGDFVAFGDLVGVGDFVAFGDLVGVGDFVFVFVFVFVGVGFDAAREAAFVVPVHAPLVALALGEGWARLVAGVALDSHGVADAMMAG